MFEFRTLLSFFVAAYSVYLIVDSIKRRSKGDFVTAIILLSLLLLTRFVSIVYVSGPSMQPTFYSGDCVLVLHTHNVERGEVIVVQHGDRWLIKRTIAFGGETVEIREGRTYINGELYEEDFEYHPSFHDIAVTEVPEDYVYFLGDNRPNSSDSRSMGPQPRENIFGREIMRLDWLTKVPVLGKVIELLASVQTK